MSPLLVLLFGCLITLTNTKTLFSPLLKSARILDSDDVGCYEGNPTLRCSVETCLELQAEVKKYPARSCNNQLDDEITLKKKLAIITKLKKARIEINGRCFGGGNAGHQAQVMQVITMEFNCQDYLNKFGK